MTATHIDTMHVLVDCLSAFPEGAGAALLAAQRLGTIGAVEVRVSPRETRVDLSNMVNATILLTERLMMELEARGLERDESIVMLRDFTHDIQLLP